MMLFEGVEPPTTCYFCKVSSKTRLYKYNREGKCVKVVAEYWCGCKIKTHRLGRPLEATRDEMPITRKLVNACAATDARKLMLPVVI